VSACETRLAAVTPLKDAENGAAFVAVDGDQPVRPAAAPRSFTVDT